MAAEDPTKSSVSRRAWLGVAAVAGAGVLAPLRAFAQKMKVTKADASYQDQPKGKQAMCAMCKFFQPPASCLVVEGTISPQGWCQRFDKKSTG